MKPIHLNSIYTIEPLTSFIYDDLNVVRFAIAESLGSISVEYFDDLEDRVIHMDQSESLDFIDAFVLAEGVEFTIEHV